jgi:anti-sigma factor RsiW
MHPDLEQLHRWMDGELPQGARDVVTAHLTECPTCSEQIAEWQSAGAALRGALSVLDAPVPAVRPETLIVRARARRDDRRRWLLAATLFIGLAGVAVASPHALRNWIGRILSHETASDVRRDPAPERTEEHPSAPLAAPPLAAAPTAGIAVTPGERFRVDFATAPRAGALSITRGTRPDLEIIAPAGAATFTSSPDRVRVKSTSEVADFRIEIPAGTQHLEIWIGSKRVFLQSGARVDCVCTKSRPSSWTVSFAANARR